MAQVLQSITRLWPQWATTMTVSLLSISLGLVAGWTSPYLAQLTSEDSPLPITQEEASWVASLMPLGRLFGAVAGSLAMEYLGSKVSLLLSGIPLIISWFCIIFANSATWLYASRTLSGSTMGMLFSCFPLYIGEISSPNIRGALVGFIVNGMPIGTLIGNIMGSHLSMMWFGIISLILSFVFMAIFPFLPQSPYHYVRYNDIEGARKAIRFYHKRCDVNMELEQIESFVKSSKSLNFRDRMASIAEPKNRRAFTIIGLLFIFMQLSGLNSVVFYMEIIIRNAKVTSIPPSTIVILISGAGIIVGWIGLYLIDRCGRRMLLTISCCGVSAGMMLLGLHFMLLEQNFDPAYLEWVPILSLTLFTLMCIGLVPVPSTMLSELFPADLKSVAGFVGSILSAIFAFVASKTYQPLVDLMGEKYLFWSYALIMLLCLFYTLYSLPETKGKTLQEIQEMLAGESHKDENNSRSSLESKAGSHNYRESKT